MDAGHSRRVLVSMAVSHRNGKRLSTALDSFVVYERSSGRRRATERRQDFRRKTHPVGGAWCMYHECVVLRRCLGKSGVGDEEVSVMTHIPSWVIESKGLISKKALRKAPH